MPITPRSPRRAAAVLIQAPRWQDFAACRDTDTRLFFPAEGEACDLARAICRRCPVQQACLAEALAEPALAGIWGGTTDEQRRRLREGRVAAPLRLPARR